MRGRISIFLSAVAATLSVAVLVAWVVGVAAGTETRLDQWVVIASGAVVAGCSLVLFYRQSQQDSLAAQQYLDLLCKIELSTLASNDSAPPIPTARSAEWSRLLKSVSQRFHESAERCAEADHRNNAAEVRVRRQADAAKRVASILSTLPEPVLAVDAFDELVLANSSAEKLFAFDAQQTERRAIQNLVRCEKLIEMLGDTRRRASVGCRTEELQLSEPDGAARWYSVTTSPLHEEVAATNGDAQGAVAVLRDISGQKEIQRRNAEFVSAVSHEMKTPLAGIKAYVELLADDEAEDDATREEFLTVINSQADRLQRLIDNLLNLARIEAGVVQVSKQSQSLNGILEEAFHVIQPAAEAKNIQLINDLSPMYLGAFVDHDLMLQAAINLLSNAVKYTPDGGQVRLRSRSLDSEVSFEVEDTGVGLSPEDCHRVFEKFYRVAKDSRMAAGTGLGLPLAKHIVEDVHGGRLTVTSTLGKGSTFVIELPGAFESN